MPIRNTREGCPLEILHRSVVEELLRKTLEPYRSQGRMGLGERHFDYWDFVEAVELFGLMGMWQMGLLTVEH